MAHLRAPRVDSDLDDIWYRIAKESGSLEIADRVIESISERFYLLSRNPHIGRERDDLRLGLRVFPAGNYLIVYRIEGDDVVILYVLHGSRDIESFFRHH
jgi:toxin ParE1/3/4